MRLRAGALFFTFFAAFFFIAISRLLRVVVVCGGATRRHEMATTPRKLINLYRGPEFPGRSNGSMPLLSGGGNDAPYLARSLRGAGGLPVYRQMTG